MPEHFLKYAFIAVYLFILTTVALYGFHRYVLVYLYIKHRNKAYQPKANYIELPRITVQLPMFNEDMVAERVIGATCAIDYPLDKLDIQVLDDSTDHSADIARAAVDRWAAKGYPISYIHREKRTGYKAGALAEGLKVAKGELVAIFDADFIPPKDILHNVVNYFTDDKIGCVQVRWDHLNRDASLLTQSQAIFLDGHFVIEHTARNRSGRFMHFNGTAGVWRRTCIDDGGGWQHDTLTEDLDLSYRCQLKGWQFVYCPQYAAPAELPPEMIAFKQQAHRWTKGSMQTAIKLLPRILKSRQLPRRIKTEAFFHLTCTIVYPMMVLLTIMMYPAFIYVDGPWKNWHFSKALFSASLFILATCSASTFFVFAQRELFGKVAGWKSLLHLPMLMALGVGICVNNTKAVFEAIWGSIKRKPSEFVRTPKYGVSGKARNDWKHREDPLITKAHAGDAVPAVTNAAAATALSAQPPNFLSFKRLMLPLIEIAFGCYMASFIFVSFRYEFARGSVPFLMIFAGGYFYVGVSSLYVLWKMQQEVDAQYAEPEELEPEIA